MGTTLFTSCGFSFNTFKSYNHHKHQSSIQHLKSNHHHHQFQICFQPLQRRTTITSMAMGKDSNEKTNSFEFDDEDGCLDKRRRSALISGVSLILSSAVLGSFPTENGMAVVKQGLLAGRVPGLSEPDEQGWRTYRRPDEKSGGHGVGWSPIIPYTFSVPEKWEEVPVSIADLGGTEIDLRFSSPQEGRLFVIVAPVLRFADNLGDNVKIEMIGTPDKVISAFGPEVIGENVEGKVLSTEVAEHLGRTYYQYELEPPHVLISATAAGNRFYMFGLTANGLQWKRHYKDLKRIADSFRVV